MRIVHRGIFALPSPTSLQGHRSPQVSTPNLPDWLVIFHWFADHLSWRTATPSGRSADTECVSDVLNKKGSLTCAFRTLWRPLEESLRAANIDPTKDKQRQLHCVAISAKRYACFMLDGKGRPVLLHCGVNNNKDRWSDHGLGDLLNPSDPESDDRKWTAQAWLAER